MASVLWKRFDHKALWFLQPREFGKVPRARYGNFDATGRSVISTPMWAQISLSFLSSDRLAAPKRTGRHTSGVKYWYSCVWLHSTPDGLQGYAYSSPRLPGDGDLAMINHGKNGPSEASVGLGWRSRRCPAGFIRHDFHSHGARNGQ